MAIDPRAGLPAPPERLINIPRLISAYYTCHPDPGEPAHRVSFDTAGHRGTPLENSFNEVHVLAICQSIADLRQAEGTSGPLYLGMDTHALSELAEAIVLVSEAFKAAGV